MIGKNRPYQKRIFTSEKEQLKDSIKYLNSDFKLLIEILPTETKSLSQYLRQFCTETFVLRDNEHSLHVNSEKMSEGSYREVFDNCREYLLCNDKKSYVQCLAQEYNKLQFDLKNFNFGITLLQKCPFQELSKCTGLPFIKELLFNYLIFIKYEEEYIQVAGVQLHDLTHLSILGEKKKRGKDNNKEKQWNHFSYCDFTLDRFQMFYCRHMGRNSGIFRKNMFFKYGITKSYELKEIQNLAEDAVSKIPVAKIKGLIIKESEKGQLQQLFYKFIKKFRDLVERRKFKGKMSSMFDFLLSRYCPMNKEKYQNAKKNIEQLITNDFSTKSDHVFESLYTMQTPHKEVSNMLRAMLEMTVPKQLFGTENYEEMLGLISHFVDMKRFENYKIQDILNKMDVFKLPWFEFNFNSKFRKQIIARAKYLLGWVISTIFNRCIIPVIKYNFYITEKHKEGNKIFYFRKPVWVLIAKLAVEHFSRDNLQVMSKSQIQELNHSKIDRLPRGKLRVLPKKGTFRPIITFNRKIRREGDPYSRGNLNQVLADTQLVLRNLKNVLASGMGFSIFDNRQISSKYDQFVKKWRERGSPKLAYFTLDIQKCYDSIDTSKLKQIIEKTTLIEYFYLIVRYFRIYRNKKPLTGKKSLSYYFNLKERSNAVRLQDDPMKILEQKIPAMNIFTTKCKMITREEIVQNLCLLCTGSVVQYEKYYWKQKVGIPQGLNVSGVLCSLYFASLEKESVTVNDGLLMRLTDDYIYLGPEEQAKKVLNQLFGMADAYGFRFNADKIAANFSHELIKKKSESAEISWIGKRININTLEMFPFVETNPAKLNAAMNVNLHRKTLHSYLKNKLKSMFTNHFASYFKPYLFGKDNLEENLKIITRLSLGKYFPFLRQLEENYKQIKKKGNNKKRGNNGYQVFILKIMDIVIHEFVIYACYLCRKSDETVLNLLYDQFFLIIVTEADLFFKSMRPHKFPTIENTFKFKAIKAKEAFKKRKIQSQKIDKGMEIEE